MRLAVVAHTIGLVVRIFGALLIAPLAVDLIYGNREEAIGFAIAGAGAAVVGEIMRRMDRHKTDLTRIEGLAVVAFSWLVVSFFAAIPYLWSGLPFVDAAFESMSGLTTTGATIFRDFSLYSEGLFFWRGMTQWLGGMGVIALFIAILPALAIAGRQLFFAEAPGPDEDRLTPRIRHTAIRLWGLYVALSIVEVVCLWWVGMPLYDAICNTLTTMSAGGFSPNPESIAGYANPAAEWVIVGFMFIAGANYSLWYRFFRGRPLSLFRDEEFRVYLSVVLIATFVLGVFLYQFSLAPDAAYVEAAPRGGVLQDASMETIARQSSFQVLTILTTAGFASDDFNLWNDSAKSVLLVLMFLGGCAGSAAGGPKLIRLWLVAKFTYVELFRVLHPHGVRPVRLGKRVVSTDVMQSIVAFFLLYLVIFSASVVILVGLGADMLTGITASIATLGNIGPGFNVVGPMAAYADFDPISKWVLFFNMWIGRLEVMTVLVFLQPQIWRTAHWHSFAREPETSV
jgi:trk system potassium uptake protein TrkH